MILKQSGGNDGVSLDNMYAQLTHGDYENMEKLFNEFEAPEEGHMTKEEAEIREAFS